jgi:hypothetical protein
MSMKPELTVWPTERENVELICKKLEHRADIIVLGIEAKKIGAWPD